MIPERLNDEDALLIDETKIHDFEFSLYLVLIVLLLLNWCAWKVSKSVMNDFVTRKHLE